MVCTLERGRGAAGGGSGGSRKATLVAATNGASGATPTLVLEVGGKQPPILWVVLKTMAARIAPVTVAAMAAGGRGFLTSLNLFPSFSSFWKKAVCRKLQLLVLTVYRKL